VTIDDFEGGAFGVVTVDVSFISLRTIANKIVDELAAPGADIVTLVKPQFEAGRAEVSKGKGVVSDPEVWRRVLEEVVSAMSDLGAATMGVMVSPLLGAEGNVEFLAHWRAHADVPTGSAVLDPVALDPDLDAVIAAAQAKRGM
jgi:23S rRNA (cytidine1920-2'-O)/16S rRNA (cytidine1409-2'-O)-methyltransferase